MLVNRVQKYLQKLKNKIIKRIILINDKIVY